MTSKLIPLGFNELLGSAFDVIFQVGHLAFAPLREIQLNCFDYAKRPTLELTRRKESRKASNLADDMQADSARVQ
jgi:hypothetical protein